MHSVVLKAKDAPVPVLGMFTYDSRSNLSAQRELTGKASGGDVIEFGTPFKAKPVVICSGGLSVNSTDVSKEMVRFSGSSGEFQIIGE
jgi:hypothetical protein